MLDSAYKQNPLILSRCKHLERLACGISEFGCVSSDESQASGCAFQPGSKRRAGIRPMPLTGPQKPKPRKPSDTDDSQDTDFLACSSFRLPLSCGLPVSGLIGFETRGAQNLGARGSMSPVSVRQLACRSPCASLTWGSFLERKLLAQSGIVEDVTGTHKTCPTR